MSYLDAWFIYRGPGAAMEAPIPFEELRRRVWARELHPSTPVARSGEPWRPAGPLAGYAEPVAAWGAAPSPAAQPAPPRTLMARFSAMRTWHQVGLVKLALLVFGVPLVILNDALQSTRAGEARAGEVLVSEDGRARVTAPRGWVKRTSGVERGELTLLDATHDMNLRVIPEPKLKSYDLAGFASFTGDTIRSRWAGKYDDVSVGPVSDTSCAGAPAKRTELRMTHTGTPFVADHYVFATPGQFVQILVIGPADRRRWQGSEVDALIASVVITDPPAPAASASAPTAPRP